MTGWKKSATMRRDARHAHPVDDVGKPPPGKKNTKRWCRGKVGVEHKTKCVDYRNTKNYHAGLGGGFADGWRLLICTECGKELEYYYPWGTAKKNPPHWVMP